MQGQQNIKKKGKDFCVSGNGLIFGELVSQRQLTAHR